MAFKKAFLCRFILSLCVCQGLSGAVKGVKSQFGNKRLLFVTILDKDPGWKDYFYLSTVTVAAAVSAQGRPACIALKPEHANSREFRRFLNTYKPEVIYFLGEAFSSIKLPDSCRSARCIKISPANDLKTCQDDLKKILWQSSDLVICSDEDYGMALSASSFASRIQASLRIVKNLNSAEIKKEIIAKKSRRVFLFSRQKQQSVPTLNGVKVHTVNSPLAAIAWLQKNRYPVEYLSLANPKDRFGLDKQSLSLVAPILAAVNKGMVVPMEIDALFQVPVKNIKELSQLKYTVQKSGRRHTIDIDINGDGDFGDRGEKSLQIARQIDLKGKKYSISLLQTGKDRKELCLTFPTSTALRERVRPYIDACSQTLKNICIVGMPTAIPQGIYRHHREKSRLMTCSDSALATYKTDHYLDFGIGRIISANVTFASITCSTSSIYPLIPNRENAKNLLFAGTTLDSDGLQLVSTLYNAGYRNFWFYKNKPNVDNRLKEAGLIIHQSHSSCQGLGSFINGKSQVDFSPSILLTSGCNSAQIDVPDNNFNQHMPVSVRALDSGCLAYIGQSGLTTFPYGFSRRPFLRYFAEGDSIGEAHRKSLNKIVTELKRTSADPGWGWRHQFSHFAKMHTLYGDPGLKFDVPIKFPKFKEVEDKVSFVTKWLLHVPVNQGGDVHQSYIKEETVLPTESEAWVKAVKTSDSTIDFTKSFPNQGTRVGYAHTYVYSKAKKVVCLWLGNSDHVRVWLNSDLKWDFPCHRPLYADHDAIPVVLKKGWNRLLVKVIDKGGVFHGWGFKLRIAGADGGAVSGLSYSAQKPGAIGIKRQEYNSVISKKEKRDSFYQDYFKNKKH